MKNYQFPIPRAALGFAAVALTALTVGTWVIAPTTTEPGTVAGATLATPSIVEPMAADTLPTRLDRIEVTAVREPTLMTTLVRHFQPLQPKPKQQT